MKSDRQLRVPLEVEPNWPDRCCSCLMPRPSASLALDGYASLFHGRHPVVRYAVPMCSGCRRRRTSRWILRGFLLFVAVAVLTFVNANALGSIMRLDTLGGLACHVLLHGATLVVLLWWHWRPLCPVVSVKGRVAILTFDNPDFGRAVLDGNPGLRAAGGE